MSRDERASGLLPSVFGLAVLLTMLGLASSVAVNLWARSSIESIAYETALEVATAPPEADLELVRRHALADACSLLGERCSDVRLSFVDSDADPMVQLRVQASASGLLPRMIAASGSVVGDLDRTIRIHKERP